MLATDLVRVELVKKYDFLFLVFLFLFLVWRFRRLRIRVLRLLFGRQPLFKLATELFTETLENL